MTLISLSGHTLSPVSCLCLCLGSQYVACVSRVTLCLWSHKCLSHSVSCLLSPVSCLLSLSLSSLCLSRVTLCLLSLSRVTLCLWSHSVSGHTLSLVTLCDSLGSHSVSGHTLSLVTLCDSLGWLCMFFCLTFSPYLFCHTLSSSLSLISRFCVILFIIPFPSPLPPSLLFLHHFTLRTPKVLLSASLLSLAKYTMYLLNFHVYVRFLLYSINHEKNEFLF